MQGVAATSKRVFGALAGSVFLVRRGLAVAVFGGLLLGLLAVVPASGAPRHVAMVPVANPAWLDHLNAWRASTGVSNLTEDTTWSAGDAAHGLYMVKNNLVTHYETPGVPYYTLAGDTAARNSNIQVSSTTATTDNGAIDWWMAAPFHALGMMDPRLTTTGFGTYRDSTTSPWQEGGALDTIRGNSFTGGSYPVYFPGNGAVEPLTTYRGGEFPDPLSACSGYSVPTGLPVFIQVGGNVATSAAGAHSFTGNGVALAHCVIDSNSPSVGSNLTYRGGVIVVPQAPLVLGVKYVVSVTVNGTPYTWSFTVGSSLLPPLVVTGVAPNAGPVAGATTVTISGNGFSSGMTSVKFGTTAAASFSVVNDSTVTAVSPAHAGGTVDVTVTTAGGTTTASALDRFTFGACSSVTASAAPPSPSTPGATVTFTGSALGCSSPLYQFWIETPGSSTWTVAQAYSTSATFNWNTTGLALGIYHYSVWARDAASAGATTNGLGSYDTFVPGTAYTLASTACTGVTALAAPASTASTGSTVTFTASATGCPSPRYEFWTLAPGSSAWQIAQPYSATASFTWNTLGLPAGAYRYSVWARDAGSSAGYDAYVPGTAYTLTAKPCTSMSASATPASPQATGTAVTITATASGCPNPRYEFWFQAPGSSTWTVAQAYSGSATFSWTTTGLPAGVYRYSVWARDAGSTGSYDSYFPGTAFTLTAAACASVTASAAPASPQAHGTTITFTASASGCANPMYEFWIQAPGSTTWTVVRAYSTSATFTWNTAGLPAGTYRYSVWVRDASRTTSYDSYFPGTAYVLT